MCWSHGKAEATLEIRAVCPSGDWDACRDWHVRQDRPLLYRKGAWLIAHAAAAGALAVLAGGSLGASTARSRSA